MLFSNKNIALWVLAMALCAAAVVPAEAQTDVANCIANLTPCLASLNATKPAASCCLALKVTIDTQLPCLCNIYKNPERFSGIINATEALTLPARCGIKSDFSSCGPSPPPAQPPPGLPTSSTGAPPGKNGAGRKIKSSVGFVGGVILWVWIMLY